MCTLRSGRNPSQTLTLFELFRLNTPALPPLFGLPPRTDHGLDEFGKFELSPPQDWSLLETV